MYNLYNSLYIYVYICMFFKTMNFIKFIKNLKMYIVFIFNMKSINKIWDFNYIFKEVRVIFIYNMRFLNCSFSYCLELSLNA